MLSNILKFVLPLVMQLQGRKKSSVVADKLLEKAKEVPEMKEPIKEFLGAFKKKRIPQTRFKVTMVVAIVCGVIATIALIKENDPMVYAALGTLGAIAGVFTHQETKRKSEPPQ